MTKNELRLEEPSCPSCGSRTARTLYRARDHLYRVDAREFRIVRCGCGLVYLTPRPVSEDLHSAYPSEYFWNAFDLRAPRDVRDLAWNLWARHLVGRRVGFLRRTLGPSRPRVLDVGCGRGLFLRELVRLTGCEATGVELQADNVRFLRERHPEIAVAQADFLDWEGPAGTFGAVTMWHVLEHMADPRRALQQARRLLAPGGVLLVGTQNVEGLSRHLQGPWWTLNDVPRHLVHYSEATLTRELAASGFEVERVWHFTEFFPVLGANLFAPWLLDERRNIRPLWALGLNLAFAPLEAIACLLKRGCVMTVAARRVDGG